MDFLVVCGRLETMETFSSMSAFKKLDFPEFGRQTRATYPTFMDGFQKRTVWIWQVPRAFEGTLRWP
jgi:hypothetical protein